MTSRQYSHASEDSGRGAQAAGRAFESGSWSDVSDHLDQTGSYDSYSIIRNNSHHTGHDELAERLFSSLDLGHGSFYLVDSPYDSRLPTASSHTGPSSLPDHSLTNGMASSAHRKPHHKHTKSKSSVTAASASTAQGESDAQGYGMKTKFLSAWNNMRHGWTMKTKTSFSYNQPIWLFGKVYSSTAQDYPTEREEIERRRERGVMVMSAMDQFKLDFTSRIWFTYRQNFPEIPGTSITSDLGWGCMLRSAQMMIAHALVMHFMGRDWRWNKNREGCRQLNQDQLFHHKIVSLFADMDSTEECPLSIHALARIGTKLGKQPGDWYGPASVAYVLRDAMEQIPVANPILNQLCVYVAPDCTVYREDVLDLCTRSRSGSCSSPRSPEASRGSQSSTRSGGGTGAPWRALVLLIPVRLGGEAMNPVYTPAIQNILAHDMCLGIIGGKPKHSVYFVGWQEDQLIYMDPHCCQETIDVREIDCSLDSYHCRSPRKMSFGKMDPSCTIGFFCKTRMDFENFCLEAPKMAAPTAKGLYPMFVLQEGRGSDVTWGESEQAGQVLKVRHLDKQGRVKQSRSSESDDFVFL